MKIHSKLFATLLSVVLLFTLSFPAFAVASTEESSKLEGTAKEIVASYKNPNGRVLCVAKNGDPRNYPEDSLKGLASCEKMGVDIVSVSVQKTKDGKLVLLEDETLDRMLVAKDSGNAASGKVSSYTLEQLQKEYYLRHGHGGSNNSSTKNAILSLSEALKYSKSHFMLFISNGWQYAADINAVARSVEACDTVIIGGATNASEISAFIKKNGDGVCHVAATYTEGATEAKVSDFTKDALKNGADLILYQTKKEGSAIFKDKNMKALKDSGRAFISTTTPSLCGERKDLQSAWEDLIETGFSVIETDYPDALAGYIHLVEDYRSELTTLITQAQALNTGNFDRATKKAISKTLEPAEKLSAIGSITLRQAMDVRYNLQETMDSIQNTGTAKYKAHRAWWTVLLIILLVIALLLGLAILVLRIINKVKSADYKKRKRFKNKFKAQAEANLQEIAEEAKTDDVPVTDEPSTTDSQNADISVIEVPMTGSPESPSKEAKDPYEATANAMIEELLAETLAAAGLKNVTKGATKPAAPSVESTEEPEVLVAESVPEEEQSVIETLPSEE